MEFSGEAARGSTSDQWHGTATFTIRPTDSRIYCTPGTYCYDFTGGEATWTCDGQTVSYALAPGDGGDNGDLTLVISDPEEPEHERTYHGLVSFGAAHERPPGCHSLGPIAWINISGHTPFAIPPGYQLIDTYDGSGCGPNGCGTQIWHWSFTPRFDN